MSSFSLAGKRLLIVGGNGYVGSAIARQAIALGAHVSSVSKSGVPKSKQPWNDKVTWIAGDALHPHTFEKHLIDADAVVHTVGTLVDTSLTHFRNPGDQGTYENLNRDTAKAVGNYLNNLGGKKMVYFSASQGARFTQRYLESKRQAEEHLLNLTHLRVSILRPGFIYSSTDRPWTMSVKLSKDIYTGVKNAIDTFAGEMPVVKDILAKAELDHSVDVQAVAIAAIVSAFSKGYDGKIIESRDMEKIWEDFIANRIKITKDIA